MPHAQPPPGFELDQPETSPQALAPEPPEGFVVDTGTSLSRAAQQPFQGFNEKFSALAGLPGDLLNPLVRRLGAAGDVLPGSEEFREQFVQGPEPQNVLERGLRRGGEVAFETAEIALPIGALAKGGRAALPAIPSRAPGVRETLIRGIAEAPQAPAAALDVVSGFTSGLAEQFGSEASQGDATVTGLSALAGGFAPTVLAASPTAFMARGVQSIRSRFAPGVQSERAKEFIGDIVGQKLTTQEAEGLERGIALQDEIPGFRPSIAEATGSPALAAEQVGLEARLSGPALEQEFIRRQANQQAIDDFILNNAPQNLGVNVDGVIDAATGRVSTTAGRIERAQKTIRERQTRLGELPEIDPAQTGELIREGVFGARRARQNEMTELANDLGLSNVDVTAEVAPALTRIIDENTIKGRFQDPEAAPPILRQMQTVLDDINAGGRPVSFGDLKGLRERISDDLIDSISGASPNRQRIRNLTFLKKDVDGMMATLTFEGAPELAANYKQFRDTYFNDFVSKFENGVAFKVLQKNQRGFFQTTDEKVATEFFQPKGQTAVRQYLDIFDDSPVHLQALNDVGMDSLRRAAAQNGTISQTKLNGWKFRHQEVLDELPELSAQVETVSTANQALNTRAASLDARGKTLESSAFVRELRKVDTTAQTPEQAINKMIKDPRRLGVLLKRLPKGSPARAGLERHMWDGATNLSAADMGNYIKDNQRALTAVFGDAHMKNLKRINDAMQIVERLPAPSGTREELSKATKFFEEKLGITPQLGANRIFQTQSRIVGARYAVADLFGRYFRNKSHREIDAILSESLYDVNLAGDLAAVSLKKAPAGPATVKKLNAWLATLGVQDEENQ